MRMLLADTCHPLRPAIERTVQSVYARQYRASITDLPPRMIAGIEPTGDIACAAGLRRAPFFSEIYLEAPVEGLLSRIGGQPVTRDRIVEVSTLAAPRRGAALELLRVVVDLCRHEGYDWAFFTATARLRALLRRVGIPMVPVAPARIDRVANPSAWGTYYHHDPHVCAVNHAMASSFPSGRTSLPKASNA